MNIWFGLVSGDMEACYLSINVNQKKKDHEPGQSHDKNMIG